MTSYFKFALTTLALAAAAAISTAADAHSSWGKAHYGSSQDTLSQQIYAG